MSKSELVRDLIQKEDWKSALKIAKDFRIGITQEQRSDMARAYECIVHPQFYISIGKNISECIEKGKSVLISVI